MMTVRAFLIATLLVTGGSGAVALSTLANGAEARAEVPLPPPWTPALQPVAAAPVAAAPEPAAPAEPVDPNAYVIKRVLDIPGPMRPGDYYWDDKDVPAGPVVITADLKAQTLSVFRAGYEIGTAVILYGADDKPTPLGIFPIKQKKADHVSTLYDAPMPYMQRLTSDGVAIHGTPVVGPNLGTHGCIGVPTPFAKLLFGVTRLGDKVIVTNGEMLQVGGAVTAAR